MLSVPLLSKRVKGNQVRILSDPVTVSGEACRMMAIAHISARRHGVHLRSASQETC